MDVVGELPIRVSTLCGQTVGGNRSVNCPRMNLIEREILVDKLYPIAVLFQQFGEKNAVRLRAVRALQIVKVDQLDLGILVSANRPPADIDLVHDVLIWIPAQVHLGHADQSLLVFREKKIVFLIVSFPGKNDFDGVVVGKFARTRSGDDHLYLRGNAVFHAQLALDLLRKVRRGLRGATQADEKKKKSRASARCQ